MESESEVLRRVEEDVIFAKRTDLPGGPQQHRLWTGAILLAIDAQKSIWKWQWEASFEDVKEEAQTEFKNKWIACQDS